MRVLLLTLLLVPVALAAPASETQRVGSVLFGTPPPEAEVMGECDALAPRDIACTARFTLPRLPGPWYIYIESCGGFPTCVPFEGILRVTLHDEECTQKDVYEMEAHAGVLRRLRHLEGDGAVCVLTPAALHARPLAPAVGSYGVAFTR